MLEYLIKSTACLAIFLLFYCAVLEKEKMHTIKRAYLLGALILALCIPLIKITQYVDVSTGPTNLIIAPGNQVDYPRATWTSANAGIALLLYILYFSGVLVTGFKCTANLFRIFRRIRQNPKSRQQDIIRVLVREPVLPHAFFHYIFINIRQFLSHGIPEEVWLHEVTHARQKHSIDVLFVELLQVVFWFNPLIYLYNSYIKSNHEFLADEGVLQHAVDPVLYQHTLLRFSYCGHQPQLASGLKYSSIKKRIIIMKRQTSKNSMRLRSVMILPLLAGIMYSFSDKVVIARHSDSALVVQPLPVQDKASPEMVAEYNLLARKYNEMSQKDFHVQGEEVERLNYIYSLMTTSQKRNAEPFPEFPEPPDAPAVIQNGSDDLLPPTPPRSPGVVKSNSSVTTVYNVDTVSATTTEISVTAPVEVNYEVSNEFTSAPAPPAPPAPPDPLKHMKELALDGAKFLYNDQPVSDTRAFEIVKNKKNLFIYILDTDSKTPLVKLSDHPIKK